MTIIDFLRLLRKHMVLLLLMPLILAALVTYLTRNPILTYSSDTTIYTGIASGTSVDIEKSFSYFANNTAFDNLINVINSRETQQEVAIRLLAQHLMLSKPDPRYLSKNSFDYVRRITPPYVLSLIVKSNNHPTEPIKQSPALPPAATDTVVNKNPPVAVQYYQHTVRVKETLYSISRLYGLAVGQIKTINGLDGNSINTGQILRIPKISPKPQPTTAPEDTPATEDTTATEDTPAIEDTLATEETFVAKKGSALPEIVQNRNDTAFSFSRLYASKNGKAFPSSIDLKAFEETVKNLTSMLKSNDTNFVYRLLNTNGPHYSVTNPSEISSVKAERIGTSDLVRFKYTSDDPGICQQTLVLFTQVCIKNYKEIKENRSDAVIKYFEYQVSQATHKLNSGEDKLLEFNKDKNIINYYEQSKAVAVAKEALDVDFNNMKIKVAGYEAGIKRLEEKLAKQQVIQLKSSHVLEKRNQLSQITFKIATAEIIGDITDVDIQNLADLKVSSEKLKEELRDAVGEFQRFNNTTEGLPIASLLNDWITQVVNYEETKAGLSVLGKRIQDFNKVYEVFAPAGANLKRIEREISVSEQEYLEQLHGLNLAKLKMQDNELSSNLKTVDEPSYPLTPNPDKRKLAIIGAAMFGFIAVLASVMALDYFDDTLRNPKKAAKALNILPLGIFPKIYLKPGVLNFPFVADRLLEMAVQRIELHRKTQPETGEPYLVLLFSTITNEGKTVISRNLASQLKKLGSKVIVIRYASDVSNSDERENNCTGDMIKPVDEPQKTRKFSFIQLLLGYSDTRVDYQSNFICDNGSFLTRNEIFEFDINKEFHFSNNYKELLANNGHSLTYVPDYVLIEIPPILYYPYPPGLVASADLPLMVCRANRVWSQADKGAVENFSKIISRPLQFILNGVELEVIESVLGDLQKKRSWFRKLAKKIVRFQFFTSNVP